MLQFFKAQKNGNGSAANFSFNSKDGAFYVEIVKQTGYDNAKNLGSFKGGAKLNSKLSLTEIGSFLNAIYNKQEFKSVHKTSDRTLTISFAPYFLKDSNEYKGFGLSLFVSKDEVCRIGFSPGELELLVEFFKFGLEKCFSSMYADDKKRRDDAFKAKQAKDGGGSGKKEPSKNEEYLPQTEEVVASDGGGEIDF